jgi:hypothetical protein
MSKNPLLSVDVADVTPASAPTEAGVYFERFKNEN